MTDNTEIWADQVALQLVGMPYDQRVKAVVRALLDYRQYLAEQLPGRDSEQQRLLDAFVEALKKRMAEIGKTGGNTGGTA